MIVPKRRKAEGKTDYKKRTKLLKSNKARIVIRKSNKYIIVQYVESIVAKDKVLYGISSKKLIQFGWPIDWQGSLKSLPACYLTGFLFGKKLLNKLDKEKLKAIVDIGMLRNVPKSRVYATIKGIKDTGIELFQNEKIFPPEERIKGGHIKKDIKSIFDEIIKKIEQETK